jgi:LmbE family N-acetylglucosaminyl deacetylase
VSIAILGEGITSRYEKRKKADPSLVEALESASRRVADHLGATRLFTFGQPDNRFDSVDLLDVVKIIEALIDDLRPAAIYTQHGGDLNIDHVQVYRATLTATRPLAGHSVKTVYAYEVASSTEWAFQQFAPRFHPNTFVNITDTLEKKVEAMALYESEARPFPHPRSPEALRAIARRWGSVVGVPAAEAFELVRDVR